MMSSLHRILSLLMVLTVPLFFMACEGDEMEDDGQFGTETEGYETPTESAPMTDTGTFATWDTDADGALTEEEFSSGLDQSDGLSQWDTDADDAISQQEFDAAFSDRDWYEAGLFSEWDTDGDGDLAEEEWEAGLFATLDENDDDKIQEDEYEDDLFMASASM